MSEEFQNVYDDAERAAAYAGLEYPGTYYLAFRDIPGLIERYAPGAGATPRRALDFGCGAGRSTRFLQELAFATVGVDIATPMVAAARRRDPGGRYAVIPDGDLSALAGERFELVLCAFTFDNVPGRVARSHLMRELAGLLVPGGLLVNLVSAPEIYHHEWVSFSTRAFPGNRSARSGERVRIVMLDVPDQRPVEDVLWHDEDYRELHARAGLELLVRHQPLGRPEDPIAWGTELHVSPWSIYGLRRGD